MPFQAECSIAAVLKTVELRGSGGSNPSLSARPRSKKVSRNSIPFVFYTFGASLLADEGVKTKDGGVPLFAQWACMGPCGEQKGWALSGATIGSVVVNPSLRSNTKQNGRPHGHPFFVYPE